jgi:hypothetical protein
MDLPKVDGTKTIVLDFNGVIDDYQGWKGSATSYPPREGVEPFLAMLVTKGYRLIVCTASNIQQVKQWICRYNLDQYIEDVVNVKPPAIVYLDDRAVTFNGDFNKAYDDIVNFHTFWENKSEEQGARW